MINLLVDKFVSDELDLRISKHNSIYTIEITSDGISLYSFSSPDYIECVVRCNKYIDSMIDSTIGLEIKEEIENVELTPTLRLV